MDEKIFEHDRIIGIYKEQFNEGDAWKIGCAAARFLPSLVSGYARGQPNSRTICIGRDMRKHSARLAAALIEGIRCAGIDVIDIGMVDTPQVYFAINHLGTCGGIQVTASHHPAKYNGLKISGQQTMPIGIDTGLSDIKHIATALLHNKGNATGKLDIQDLTEAYKKHVRRFLAPNLRKLKIAVDASNGMAGKIIPALLGDLPIEILEINFTHDGTFKHVPDPLVEENLTEIKSVVNEQKCDFGLCFDGDADRLMVVDEKGQPVGCDLITALMVPYFLKKKPRSAVVYDLRSSRVVQEEIIKNGGTPRRERVGHTYMKKAMRDSHAVFGGELSGHFYYSDNFSGDSGIITLVHLLNIVSEAEVSLSQLIKPLRRYRSSGEIHFQAVNKEAKMKELAKRYSEGQADQLDGLTVGFKDWWFNCRPSPTEPLLRINVEAKTKILLNEKLSEIQNQLGEPV